MFKKLRQITRKYGKEKEDKIMTWLGVGATVIFCIWALCSPSTREAPSADSSSELGTTIPRGFSIIPIELSNAQGLSGMISKNAVVDVFAAKKRAPLLENLRLLKLSAGEGPLFGALVPEKNLGEIQSLLSQGGLKGVLKPSDSGPTRYHVQTSAHRSIQEITIREDL